MSNLFNVKDDMQEAIVEFIEDEKNYFKVVKDDSGYHRHVKNLLDVVKRYMPNDMIYCADWMQYSKDCEALEAAKKFIEEIEK